MACSVELRTKLTVPAILALLFVMTAAHAAEPPQKRPPELDQPHEKGVEWTIRSLPGPRLTAPPAVPTVGGFVSVQVNIDEFGNNILNDAGNEPSIAVDPTAPNRMVIGWRQFDTVLNNFRQGGWGYSHDGGRTWTFPGVLEPGVFRSDPVLDFDAEGNFYYNSLRVVGGDFDCQVFKSSDGGVTWGEPIWAWGGDKQWMVIDRTGGIGHGNIYANWTVFFSVCNGQFTRSYDGGQSFLDCIDVPNEPQWGTLAVGPDGELYIAGTGFLVAKSTTLQDEDLPADFDFVSFVDLNGNTVFGDGPNPGGLLGQTWVAVDNSDGPMRGNVYLLSSVNPPGSDPLDVMFSRSTNGGVTWSDPVRVNDDPTNNGAWQWFGTMSVAPNGRIDVIWNDTRNTGQTNMSELFYSFSTDGGVTWSINTQASPVFNSWVGWPDQSKIGDYYDMISDDVGANLAWAATFNNEQDVYYLRIGDYDCNGNGIGDTDDLANGDSDDCNENDIPDECEIAAGTVLDDNGNGIPDECEGDIVGPDDFSAFRGFYDSGDLDSLLEADDDKLCYSPGITLAQTEAPITLDFTGTLPTDSPASLDVTIESSANTVGLELTISFWNYNTKSWDVVGTDMQTNNVDTVRTFAGVPADHVEPGSGEVMTRYEVRVVSFIFVFPWLDCVDHVFWTVSN